MKYCRKKYFGEFHKRIKYFDGFHKRIKSVMSITHVFDTNYIGGVWEKEKE